MNMFMDTYGLLEDEYKSIEHAIMIADKAQDTSVRALWGEAAFLLKNGKTVNEVIEYLKEWE